MAFDGVTIAALTNELRELLLGGRVYKIAQPEKDELLITIKNNNAQYRLNVSANPSLPIVYLTKENKKSPMTAPNFCMLLRKHIQNARIIEISQPSLERIIDIKLEHLNEMGDLCQKILSIEMMGKHSNIIFREDKKIIDSIKHIPSGMSSIREVLPGREYFIPFSNEKYNPLSLSKMNETNIFDEVRENQECSQFLVQTFTGVSPIMAQEICYKAKIDSNYPMSTISRDTFDCLMEQLKKLLIAVTENNFAYYIYYENDKPLDFSVIPLDIFQNRNSKRIDSVSEMLFSYYDEKSLITRIHQKSVDLRKIVQLSYERNIKKYDLQKKQLADTNKRERFKIYGELLHTYGYLAKEGDTELVTINYYDNQEIKIPLDKDLTALENAKKYFDKYMKYKRTYEALTVLLAETQKEVEYLESVTVNLNIARSEEDLAQIKDELVQSGYIKKKGTNKKVKYKNQYLQYISSDGYTIYVGKNNIQNEEITFQIADNGDWWFHAKGIPGSHVIVKCGGKELSDKTYEEAAKIAGYYSKGREQNKVEIDYLQRKFVKKPNGAALGFVIYHTNYSMAIKPDISEIQLKS